MSFRIGGIERIFDNGDLVTVVTKNAVRIMSMTNALCFLLGA